MSPDVYYGDFHGIITQIINHLLINQLEQVVAKSLLVDDWFVDDSTHYIGDSKIIQ